MTFASCGRNNIEDALSHQVRHMGGESLTLGSVEYTISKIIAVDNDVLYKIGDRKVLFSSLSTMKAGVDLSNFCADSVKVNAAKKAITINLPKPKIIAFNMPAENIRLEYSKSGFFRSDFSAEERNEILKQGEEAILKDAEEIGIFEEAEKNVKLMFETLLAGTDYKEINVVFN